MADPRDESRYGSGHELRSMRAAVAHDGNRLSVEEIPIPVPAPGEVRVRVTACGICGSDLHFYRAGMWAPGATPGHEITGEIDALGDGVEGVATGDAVAIEPLRSCGRCDSCRAGLDAICRESQIYGIHRPGGLAEYVCVPAKRLFALPPDLDPRIAALSEPMAVVVHGLRRGGLAPGERVLVLGAGSLGLLSVVAARAMGASDVWLTARHPHQAELGVELGATRVLNEADASPFALDELGKEAPVDLVVETVGGKADTLISAGTAVRPGGTISVLGVFMGRIEIEPLSLFMKENTLTFSNCYSHPAEDPDFAKAVALVCDHRDALTAVTTHESRLEQVEEAFVMASDKKAGAVKVTVLP